MHVFEIVEKIIDELSDNFLFYDKNFYRYSENSALWKVDDHGSLIRKKFDELNINFQPSIYESTKKFVKDHYQNSTNDNFDGFDKIGHHLNFKNGLYDLKNYIFRKRTKYDYVTECLNFDYKEEQDSELICKVNEILYKILNCSVDLLEEAKKWVGNCITGQPSHKICNINNLKGNVGQTTLIHILQSTFSIYCYSINKWDLKQEHTRHRINNNNNIRQVFVFTPEIINEPYESKVYFDINLLVEDSNYFINHPKFNIISDTPIKFVKDGESDDVTKYILEFNLKNQFVNNPINDCEYQVEFGLLDDFKKEGYKLALVQIILPYAIASY